MRPTDLLEHLRKQPFQPIRVFISDGKSYDVRHPEMMLITRTEVVIALDPGVDEVPERKAYCDPVHITRVEPIDGHARRRRATGRR
jgi:hypothetical protein